MARGRTSPAKVTRDAIDAIRNQLQAIASDLSEALEAMEKDNVPAVSVHYYPTALLGLESLSRFAGQCRTQARFLASVKLVDGRQSEHAVVKRIVGQVQEGEPRKARH